MAQWKTVTDHRHRQWHPPQGRNTRVYSISEDSERFLGSLERFGVRLGLDNVSDLLRRLGDPQKRLRAIHIGGTNGKGSTAACLSSILTQAGYRVGLYTSPHLHDFRERIQINGNWISPDRIDDLVAHVRRVLHHRHGRFPVTYFECVTAIAFLYFYEEKVDLAVVEVGMGGRMDATNLLQSLVSVISTVSMDHQEYLGHTLSKITREKAGIIHPGGTVVSGVWQKDLQKILIDICGEKMAHLFLYGRDFSTRYRAGGTCDYYGMNTKLSDLALGLHGRHQGKNAGLTLASVELLRDKGYRIGKKAILSGLTCVQWPCRLEVVGRRPLIVLDGAHNADGAYVLSAALKEEFRWDRLFLIFGVLRNKDYPTMLSWLSPLANRIILTQPGTDRALSPRQILKILPTLSEKACITRDVREALERACEEAGPRDCICVSGSLFTAAAARQVLCRLDGMS